MSTESESTRLASLLSEDFASPDQRELEADPDAPVFAKFVSVLRTPEDIEERGNSAENESLGEEVRRLLQTAPITDYFKEVIVQAVRRAHAYEDSVTDLVSPTQLGLKERGIYSEPEARDIEARCLRMKLHDIVRGNLVIPVEDGVEQELRVIYPESFTIEMNDFNAWRAEYHQLYGEDALEGAESEAYQAAATQVTVIKPGDPGWELFDMLDRQKDDYQEPE